MSCSIYMYHFLNYKYLLSQTGSVLMWENTSNFNLIICAQSSVKLEKKYVCTYLNILEAYTSLITHLAKNISFAHDI